MTKIIMVIHIITINASDYIHHNHTLIKRKNTLKKREREREREGERETEREGETEETQALLNNTIYVTKRTNQLKNKQIFGIEYSDTVEY